MVTTIDRKGLVCAICQEEWPKEDALCPQLPPHLRETALKCGHVFHAECRENLINASRAQSIIRCPICRAVEPIYPSTENEGLSSEDLFSTDYILNIARALLVRDLDRYIHSNDNFPMISPRANAQEIPRTLETSSEQATTNITDSPEQGPSSSLSYYNLILNSLSNSGMIDSNQLIISDEPTVGRASRSDDFAHSPISNPTLAQNQAWESFSTFPDITLHESTTASGMHIAELDQTESHSVRNHRGEWLMNFPLLEVLFDASNSISDHNYLRDLPAANLMQAEPTRPPSTEMVSKTAFKGLPCAICQEEWPEEDDLCPQLPPHLRQTALNCGHIFHVECKENLINASRTQSCVRCPLCRAVEPIHPFSTENQSLSSLAGIVNRAHAQIARNLDTSIEWSGNLIANSHRVIAQEVPRGLETLPERVTTTTTSTNQEHLTLRSPESSILSSLPNFGVIDSNGRILYGPTVGRTFSNEFSSSIPTSARNRFLESSSTSRSIVSGHTSLSSSPIVPVRSVTINDIFNNSFENNLVSLLENPASTWHAPSLQVDEGTSLFESTLRVFDGTNQASSTSTTFSPIIEDVD